MVRNELKAVAQETLNIVQKGSYEVYKNKIKLNNVEKGRLYTSDRFENIDISDFKVFNETTIEVVNEGTVDAIFRLKGNKVGVLNFASAHHPGGGFENGAVAQEECLAYCSNLYNTLKGNEFYKIHDKIRTKMYTDNMIVGNVEFFRNSNYNFVLFPKTVKVVTSAAVNMCQVRLKGEDEELAKQVMKNRMRKILNLFAEEGCETIVLGAFGCGVFKNDPIDIANNWKDILESDGFYKYFREIVFSIYDKPGLESNFTKFKKIINK